MIALDQTGWINFNCVFTSFVYSKLRSRLERRVYHMARLFLDYEPGIHYPQFQMQAGQLV